MSLIEFLERTDIMIITKVIEAKKFFDGTKDMLENRLNDTKAALDSTKEKLGAAKNKLAQYNVKKVRAIAVTLGVISMVLSAAALAVAIVALVKSCKAKRNSKIGDYSYYIDDSDCIDDYSLGVDHKNIDENDIPADDAEE